MRRLLRASVVGWFGCAGASIPKKPPPPPQAPPVVVSAPVPISPARWHLRPTRASEVSAAPLELSGSDAGRKLFLTGNGERWMISKGTATAASSLSPEGLAGGLASANGFTFITAKGRVLRTGPPLSDLDALKEPQPFSRGNVHSATAGRAALLVVAAGTLYRSVDQGQTWTTAAVPAGPWVVRSVALNPKGEGLLLAHPQRVLATIDDGLTWSPVPSTGIGGTGVTADATGAVLLRGPSEAAVLSGGKLTSGSLQQTLPDALDEERAWGMQIAFDEDDRVAILGPASAGFELRVGAIGALPAPRKIELGECEHPQLAMYGGKVLVGCDVRLPGGLTDSTRILSSEDGGKTFREETTLASGDGVDHNRPGMFYGPRGFAVLDRRCSWVKHGRSCLPARVRVAGSETFVALTVGGLPVGGSLVKDGMHTDVDVQQVVLSKAGDRYYVLASGGGIGAAVYSASVEESELVLRMSLDVPSAGSGVALSLDDSGRMLLAREGIKGWMFRRAREDGSEAATWWVPIPFSRLALKGARGLGIDEDGRAWETADAGVHFREVGVSATPDAAVRCGAFGCVVGARVREGWDEPLGRPTAIVTAISGADAVAPANPWSRARPPGAKAAYASPFHCSGVGPRWNLGRAIIPRGGSNNRWTAYATLDKDAEYAIPTLTDDGSAVLRLARKSKKPGNKDLEWRDVPMLGPEPVSELRAVVTRAESQPGGVVVARYNVSKSSLAAGKSSDPVDVELAWWTPTSGKVRRLKLPGYPAFRVPTSRYSTEVTAFLDGEQLWFHGGDRSATGALVLSRGDPEKPLELSWPKTVGYSSSGYGATRSGTKTLLFSRAESSADAAQVHVRDTDDGPWTKRVWALAPAHVYEGGRMSWMNRQATLIAVPTPTGSAFLSTFFDGPATHSFLSPITGGPDPGGAGPSAVVALPPATSLGDALSACDEQPGLATRVPLPWAAGLRHPIIVDAVLDNGESIAGSAETLVRLSPSGTPCGLALGFGRWSNEGGVLPLADRDHGLYFQIDQARDGLTGSLRARRISCKIDKGGKLPESLEDEEGFWR